MRPFNMLILQFIDCHCDKVINQDVEGMTGSSLSYLLYIINSIDANWAASVHQCRTVTERIDKPVQSIAFTGFSNLPYQHLDNLIITTSQLGQIVNLSCAAEILRLLEEAAYSQ